MPKRELSKCREWERERRERLKTCFEALSRLLPSHDPSITPSKLEILQRAAQHINDLQQKNKELLLGDQKSTQVVQRDEIRRLRERVKKLNGRNEQLAGLLKTAGLKVPKECLGRISNQNGVFKGPPKLWSGRLSKEKAEILRKKHENCDSPTSKQKRKRVSTGNKKSTTQNNEPQAKKPKKCTKKSLITTSANLASKVATVLGPGTLILANGSVVPVPGPPATLHRIQIVPTVQQPNQQVIVMQQRNSAGISNKLPVLKPKCENINKQSLIATKVAIPSLPKKKNMAKKPKNSQKNNNKQEKIENKTNFVENKAAEIEKTKSTEKNIEKPPETEPKVAEEKKIEQEPEKEAPKLPEKPEEIPANETTLLQEPQVSDTEISNDIFASLGTAGDSAGVIGAQHTESMSPTAAFLLAFPLVSTLTGNRLTEQSSMATGNSNICNNNNNNDRDTTEDDRQSTPTLLQIGGELPDKSIENINKSRNILHQISENTKETSDFRYFNQNNEQINRQNRDLNPEPQPPPINACLYEKNTTNQFYPYCDIRPPEICQKTGKNRSKSSSQRAPVNWMTTPDIRPNSELPVTGNTSGTNDYFLPPFSDVYSGILQNNSDQNFTWNSNRSVLPTLIGDLALGVTCTSTTTTSTNPSFSNSNKNSSNSTYYNNLFDPPNFTSQFPQQNKENSSNFLSVSSILVGGKARRSVSNNQNTKKRDKHKSTRINENFDNHKKYSGGYSAEELIGEAPYQLSENSAQQFLNQNQNNQVYSSHQQSNGYQVASRQQRQTQQQQQAPFGAAYPSLPPTGEFSALLNAAVVDTYSKTYDNFVHKQPTTFEGYCTANRRHSRRSGPPGGAGGSNSTATTTANATGFSELSFLSMSGAVNSPILQDEFHTSAPFLTNAPPPIPTPAVSSLTNFNLSAIFPEINKGVGPPSSTAWPHSKPAASTSRSQPRYQQNQQEHNKNGYSQQQHTSSDALYGGGAPAQSFPGILHTNSDVNSAPTNFSFSFAAP